MSNLPGAPVEEERRERGDLADPKKVARKATWEKIEERRRRENVLFILSTIQGRAFYWDLMTRCGIFKSSFTGNNSTFFNEGERNIGLQLMADLNEFAPEAYLQMVKESKLAESNRA